MENNKYAQCQNKVRKNANITTLVCSLIILIGLWYLSFAEDKGAKESTVLLIAVAGTGCLYGICSIIDSFNKNLYFPKYQIGDIVIISKKNENGKREYNFSQYDGIINQIPKYSVKEIGDCSYLLAPENHQGHNIEFNFKKYDDLFSIAEFKERAKCC